MCGAESTTHRLFTSVVTRQTLNPSPSRVFLGMTDEPREDDIAEHWERSCKEIRICFQVAPQK